MVVVDASTVLELLLARPAASALRKRLFDRVTPLHVPHLIDVEVAHVIRRYALLGELDAERAESSIAKHLALPFERHSHDALLGVVWQLRDNFTAYDAIYVALGVALRATFITADLRLARAAEALLPVEVFA